jgi:hypothetical protein
MFSRFRQYAKVSATKRENWRLKGGSVSVLLEIHGENVFPRTITADDVVDYEERTCAESGK